MLNHQVHQPSNDTPKDTHARQNHVGVIFHAGTNVLFQFPRPGTKDGRNDEVGNHGGFMGHLVIPTGNIGEGAEQEGPDKVDSRQAFVPFVLLFDLASCRFVFFAFGHDLDAFTEGNEGQEHE